MLLTTKVRVFPTSEQKQLLWNASRLCRKVYNYCLIERQNHWNENKTKPKEERAKSITKIDQTYQIPYLRPVKKKRNCKRTVKNIKKPKYKFITLRRLPERVFDMTINKLDANYKSFYSLIKTWNQSPQYKTKNGKKIPLGKPRAPGLVHISRFVPLCYNRDGMKIIYPSQTKLCDNTNGCKSSATIIQLAHYFPNIDTKLNFEIPNYLIPKGTIKQIEISRDRDRRYFASLVIENDDIPFVDNGLIQAADLGINTIYHAINLQGKEISFSNIDHDKKGNRAGWIKRFEKRTDELNNLISKCRGNKRGEKKSRRYKKLSKTRNRIKKKISNKQLNFHHRISRIIIEKTKANTIIIGDLEVKKMATKKQGTGVKQKTKANKTLNRSLMSGGLGRFAQFLTYKAESVGKRVIRISERNTTKACCLCGQIHDRKLSDRILKCDCGLTIPRDLNSAFNIMKRFIEEKNTKPFVVLKKGKYMLADKKPEKGECDVLSRTSSLAELNFIDNYELLVKEAARVSLNRSLYKELDIMKVVIDGATNKLFRG